MTQPYEPPIICAARRGAPGWVLDLMLAAEAQAVMAQQDEREDDE